MDIKYKIIRSSRKTLSLEVKEDLSVLVRAPIYCLQKDIDSFVKSHTNCIEEHIEQRRMNTLKRPEPTFEEREEQIRYALEYLPERTAHYAAIMGVSPTSMKITDAKKRFGSCSPKNGICYSWRLMLYPTEAVDYVVVHEMAHIIHKNHSKDFHALVEKILPDHKSRRGMLKG